MWAMDKLPKSREHFRRHTHFIQICCAICLVEQAHYYRLTVRDEANRIVRAQEKTVEITTTGPQGSVPVIIE